MRKLALLAAGGLGLLFLARKSQVATGLASGSPAAGTVFSPVVGSTTGAVIVSQQVRDYVQPITGTPEAFFTGGEANNPAALGGWYSDPNLTSAQVSAGGFTQFWTAALPDTVWPQITEVRTPGTLNTAQVAWVKALEAKIAQYKAAEFDTSLQGFVQHYDASMIQRLEAQLADFWAGR